MSNITPKSFNGPVPAIFGVWGQNYMIRHRSKKLIGVGIRAVEFDASSKPDVS